MDSPITLNATNLSQFIRLRNCQRYLRFSLVPDEMRAMQKRWKIELRRLSPLLADEGTRFEDEVIAAIRARGEPVHAYGRNTDPAVTFDQLRNVTEPVILAQAPVQAIAGRYQVGGIADVVRLARDGDGALHIYVADIKSSRQEKMEHRLQIAVYAYALQQMAEQAGQRVGSLFGGVLHKQDDEQLPVFDPDTPTFDLTPYLTAFQQLVVQADSVANQVVDAAFDDVPYTLGYWCDGCRFNALCMYDSAERLDLALIPVLSTAERRACHQAGVQDLVQLAQLMQAPPRGSNEMETVPQHAETVAELAGNPLIAADLPLIVQRAQAIAGRLGHVQRPPTGRIYSSHWGTLPDENHVPGLVKIFFDAQADYLRQRVYLLSALVVGPNGEQTVVHHTEAPPTHETEQQLLTTWLAGIVQALLTVADGVEVPVHLYCYNGLDQITLLEALKRHIDDVVALVPGFFDFMTQSPALDQVVISFLAPELHNQQNLGLTCMPLHDTADTVAVWNGDRRPLRFHWMVNGVDYRQLFHKGLHDNWRTVVRREDGRIALPTGNVRRGDPGREVIEANSRFNSQIPLEYPYAAWGELPNPPDLGQRREFDRSYRQVNWQEIVTYSRLRVKALQHIEASFAGRKSRFVEKPPIDIGVLAGGETPSPSLAQSLREFIYIEHYAAYQQRMQVYALPIERRVQTGLALLLRFVERDHLAGTWRFTLAADELGLDPVQTMNGFRPKEGSWMVLNAVGPQTYTRDGQTHTTQHDVGTGVRNGRLAIIQRIDGTTLELDLIDFPIGTSDFKYWHRINTEPEAGSMYTLDEMADDLNADKHLAALANAAGNVFYGWLNDVPSARPVTDEWDAQAVAFGRTVDRISYTLTDPQRQIVTQHFGDPILLVQGPPGTGKSQTIGWAVLSRLLLRVHAGQPFRIAVSSKTHNAVDIVLAAIAEKWALLQSHGLAPSVSLLGLPIFKITNDIHDAVPAGVQPLVPREARSEYLNQLIEQSPFFIIGGTPGGIYNLSRYRARRASDIDWQTGIFDLVIIDEASQTSQPEAILAAAWLNPNGQALVVGDHRQMPPIIQHAWESEEKRTTIYHAPHLSIFDALRMRDVPSVALDQSFRLHHTIADFLQDNVYYQDNIRFFSRRSDLIAAIEPTNSWVDGVMDPQYPIVVIEHSEEASHQYNETELAILEPILNCCCNDLGLDGRDGLGIVVPHRAQKSLLRTHFPALADSDAIDTVERFQGGERDVIIVSATASDPDYVLAEADFLLNVNRLNVALSRPRKKLIVVASRSVSRLLVSDLNTFENAVIWKRLFYHFTTDTLYRGPYSDTTLLVRGRPVDVGR